MKFNDTMTDWRRFAGEKVYHLSTPDWIRTGNALCGRNTTRAYVYQPNDASLAGNIEGRYEQLADYPRTFGKVKRCAKCLKAAQA